SEDSGIRSSERRYACLRRAAPNLVRVIPTAYPALSRATVEPAAVEWLMAGDYMTKLRWHNWGGPRATARGLYNLNLCNPCAAGHTRRYPGRVTLSRILVCRGVRIYTAARSVYRLRGTWHAAEGLGDPINPCSRDS